MPPRCPELTSYPEGCAMADETDPSVQRAQPQWEAARQRKEHGTSNRDPSLGLCKDHAEKAAAEQRQIELVREVRLAREAEKEKEEKALQRDKVKRGYAPDASTAPRQLIGRSLAGVAMHAIEWLWIGWIPKGYVTLFA